MEKIIETIKKNLFAVLVPLALYMLILAISPTSRNWNSAWILIKQAFAPTILAWGVMFAFGVGNWDFSVGADVLLASIIGGHIAQDLHLGVPGLVIGAILIGILCGLCTATMYRVLRIPTLITTLGMLLIYESISGWLFDGKALILDTSYVVFGKFPVNLIAFILVYIAAYLLYYKLPIGYRIRAVGYNIKVSEANGINATRAKMEAMVIVGFFAGVYGAINTGSSGQAVSMNNMASMSVCFSAMMCVCIGNGIAGKGNKIFAMYCGSLVVQIVNMLMMAMHIPQQFQKVIVALVVIILMINGARPRKVKAPAAGTSKLLKI